MTQTCGAASWSSGINAKVSWTQQCGWAGPRMGDWAARRCSPKPRGPVPEPHCVGCGLTDGHVSEVAARWMTTSLEACILTAFQKLAWIPTQDAILRQAAWQPQGLQSHPPAAVLSHAAHECV